MLYKYWQSLHSLLILLIFGGFPLIEAKSLFLIRKRLEETYLLTSYLSERNFFPLDLAPCLKGIFPGANSAPFHNGITVGCWASKGHSLSQLLIRV
jgi:hypothetical protein